MVPVPDATMTLYSGWEETCPLVCAYLWSHVPCTPLRPCMPACVRAFLQLCAYKRAHVCYRNMRACCAAWTHVCAVWMCAFVRAMHVSVRCHAF